jgi:hypothetical protein
MYDCILKLANIFSSPIVKLSALGYHVSRIELEEGKTYWFDPALKGKGIGHTIEEWILEKVRSEEFPDKPSRTTSFYSYPYPKTPWESAYETDYYLYEVEPIGKIHIGDVEWLNELVGSRYYDDKYKYSLSKSYWEGKSCYNLSNLEIVSSGIKVINKFNKRKIYGKFRLKTNIILEDIDHKVHQLMTGDVIHVSAKYKSSIYEENKRKPNLNAWIMKQNDTSGNYFPLSYQPKKLMSIVNDILENKFKIVEPIDNG